MEETRPAPETETLTNLVTEKLISDVKEKGPIHMTLLPVNGVDSERHRRGILGNMDCRDGAFFTIQLQF